MPSAGSDAAKLPRLHCAQPLAGGQSMDLPPGAARHAQVLRLQPGAAVTLFDGRGGEYGATIERMGRSSVQVLVGEHRPIEREARRAIHLAVGIPANERMDWLVEKATELGAASIQPLLAQRSVVRLSHERGTRRQAHWQGVAIAACEQCGRNRVPLVHEPAELAAWLRGDHDGGTRWVLSLGRDASEPTQEAAAADSWTVLSGPEGGLAPEEEAAARAAGFRPMSLGPRVLRAETAPLVALARWAL
jgi:16S rRNA (uracil1498-N3)-methyltransferase